MKEVVFIFCTVFFFQCSLAQTSSCHFSIGFQGQDFITSIVPLSNSTYLVSAANDTLRQTVTGVGVFPQMLIYKLNNQCDTLWKKALTPIGLGGLSNLRKVNENKILASGGIINSAFFQQPGNIKSSPFVMLLDSNAIPLNFFTYSSVIGGVVNSFILPNGDIMLTGHEISTPSSNNFRVFIALLDSSLNPKWYRKVLPQSLVSQTGSYELILTNDGCGLLLVSELLSNPNMTRPRLVKFDLQTGDTIQTKYIEPTGVANYFELKFMSLYRDEIVLSWFYQHFINSQSSNENGVIIKLDHSFNENARYIVPHKTLNGVKLLDNGYLASVAISYLLNPIKTSIHLFNLNLTLLDSSFEFPPINLVVSPNIAQFEPNQWVAYGSTATSVATFGLSDMYFSVINHSYGAPYVHDYCGADWPDSIRIKPEAGFTATATTDSIFFNNTSISGLQCQAQIAANEWYIDNYQLSDTGFHLGVPIAPLTDTLRVRLIVSNYFGCRDTVEAQVINNTGQILGTASSEWVIREPRLYPNPARSQLQIDLHDYTYHNYQYRIMNATGRMVGEGSIYASETMILPIDHLLNGVYFLQLMNDENIWQFKFIKQ